MIALAGSVLIASLLGSPHCAAMCGGFVCFYAGEAGDRRGIAHALYNAGRLATYVVLGVVAGALGARVEELGASLGVARAAAVLAGAMMIGWGAMSLGSALAWIPPPGIRAGWTRRPIARVVRAIQGRSPAVRALVVGAVTTLLPCGWLYAFVAVAAGTGSATRGALVMAAFWAGTLPVMAGIGLAAQGLFGTLRRRLPVVSASLLIVLGALTIAGKLAPSLAAPDRAPACHSTSAGGVPVTR